MIFFKNKEVWTTTKTTIKDNKGQLIVKYDKGIRFLCDVQPVTAESIKKTWGIDLESSKQIFSDVFLKVGDIVLYKNVSYEIEKKVEWDSYNIYAIKEMDVKIQ